MQLSSLIRLDGEYKSFLKTLAEAYSASEPLPVAVNGLSGGAAAAFLVESVREARAASGKPVLVTVRDEGERERVTGLLSAAGVRALGYKRRDLVFHNVRASHDVDRERLSVLSALAKGECDAVVSTPSAAATYTLPYELLASLSLSGRLCDILSPEELAKRLLSLGFAPVDTVDGVGQFSRRGGILDFWGGDTDEPTRVEFFGDEIDRISSFDPITQRTSETLQSFSILPATEVIVDGAARARILAAVEGLLAGARDSEAAERLGREAAILRGDGTVDFRDKYLGLVYKRRENLFDYLSRGGRRIAFVVDTAGCREDIAKHEEYYENERKALLSLGTVTEEAARYTAGAREYENFLSENITVHQNSFAGGVRDTRLAGLFGFRTRKTVAYGGNPAMLIEDIVALRRSLYRVVLLTDTRAGADSLVSSLADSDIAAVPIYDKPDFDIGAAEGGRIFVTVGTGEGFDLIVPRVAVLSMARDEGRAVMQNRRRQRILKRVGGAGERLMSYADLSPGDYVVHASYGIGLFEGVEAVTVDGVTRDYITIRYAGTDKLFVPCDRLELIGKYIGERDRDGKVKLSKMGGTEWHKTRTRAKSAAKDMAKRLIALYAERQRKPGFAFPEDSDLEYAFADSFEYELTDSQATAVREICADMTRPVPMNRLLCGDVGFGKTEVALRAAFKAIMGGKQVAILVPTTILALQHYQTALSRMRGYPVTVEMLSRFKRPRESAEILRKVKRGETDILIGTHRLLSKKLEFYDLGLLIIDEEQRFGVAQKEKLKELAVGIDVLTLTATPIPRTLNMAMNGISDISILDEAPGERRPVQTYVLEHDDAVIFDALRRELARGGQVLYLYNKVETIDLVAGKIMRELPEARVAYAHGQMEKEELEDIWHMLVAGEIDILVCTTIIETGVDLPMANTLVIENADRFGLAQLHQIRGRVGRSGRQAYAYFTYRAGKALSEVAEKRLSAIREFAEFGAGFKIALRDLEIRGAGNLLGAEQHGYIDSVGYDLYVKLLSEAVLEERGEARERPEAVVDMPVSAHIPESYIPVSAQRMEMYKKISLITSREDADDVSDEFIDRFGDMPRSVTRLISVGLTRALATEAGLERVEARGNIMTFVPREIDLGVWSELFGKYSGMRFAAAGMKSIVYKFRGEAAEIAADILEEYIKIKKQENENDDEK